jgi:hypothetical protein
VARKPEYVVEQAPQTYSDLSLKWFWLIRVVFAFSLGLQHGTTPSVRAYVYGHCPRRRLGAVDFVFAVAIRNRRIVALFALWLFPCRYPVSWK